MLRNYQAGINNINRGSGSSMVLIYLALVSISSVAFATVTSKKESTITTEKSVEAVGSNSMTRRAKQLVQLNNYRGEITRKSINDNSLSDLDSSSSQAQIKARKTFWNPLAKVWLTREQTRLLNTAFNIAYEDGGLHHAQLIQSVMLQETIAGLMGRIGHMSAPVGKRSYGVMQVKVTAATDVLRKHSGLGKFKSDEEIIASLIIDDVFNIRVASKFLLHLRSRTKSDDHALLAYNIGLRGSKRHKRHSTFRYVKKVKRYFDHLVTPFNERYNTQSVISKNSSVTGSDASS